MHMNKLRQSDRFHYNHLYAVKFSWETFVTYIFEACMKQTS